MKTVNQKPTLLSKLYCVMFGHNYLVSKKITHHVKEYACSNCNHELTTNGNGSLIELSPKYREINEILLSIHKKKITRLSREVISPTVYRMTS